MKKFLLLFLSLALVACEPEVERYNGYVEGEYLYMAPTSSGILATLSVARGQEVAAGDKLFALDKTNLKATLAEAEASIAQNKVALQNAESEYRRATSLLVVSGISKEEAETKKANFDKAKAALDSALQKRVQAERLLVESAPKAPVAGRIEDTYFRVGEYVAAGTPVASLLPPENVKVRFYVPQAALARFPLGTQILIHCDGCGAPLKAKVNFIASQTEYTPPVIYSVGSRDKLVFRVEALPEVYAPVLRPGLPIDIEREAK